MFRAAVRRLCGTAFLASLAGAALGLAAALPDAAGARVLNSSAQAQTFVSIDFDDGNVDQYNVGRPILQSHGYHATFFINSGNVGASSKYMTWQMLHDLASDGDEIAGHTVLQPDLTTLDAN